jgi:chromobox protein 1
MGYDKAADNTWEDEDNCTGSTLLIEAYWDDHGGRPAIMSSAQKKGSRKRTLSTPISEGGAAKRRRQNGTADSDSKANGASDWKPPSDLENWDDKVSDVETVEKTDKGLILVYLHWYFPLSNWLTCAGKTGKDLLMILRLCIKSARKG